MIIADSPHLKITLLSLCLLLNTALCAQDLSGVEENIPADLTIDTEAVTPDRQIKNRLTNIFKHIEDLQRVEVAITSGVVTLSGTVPDSLSREEAVTLTRKTSGVIYVRDRLEEDVAVDARISPALEKAQELTTEFTRKIPILIIALLVIAIAWLLGTWISNRQLWLARIGMNELAASLLKRVIRLVIIAIGIFVALEILDATALAGAILGVAGVAGVALGFAFRNIIENYLAGILLSTRNPFSSGDAIEIDGVMGKVIRLTSRDTVLMTFDGNHLRIPNNKMITSSLTNFSRNPLRRFDFAIGVSVELDMTAVRQLGMNTLTSIPAVLEDPAPMIVIEELGDSTVNMRFFAWIDQREDDFLKSKSEAIRKVKDAFDDAGVEMPEPIYRLHLRNTDQTTGQAPTPDQQAKQQKKVPQPTGSDQITDETTDTRADRTIDEQVKKAQQEEDEPNLLDK